MKASLKIVIGVFITICFDLSSTLAYAKLTNQNPNIILIYSDDLGYGDISNYGGQIPTPHIDNLAKNGLKFTSAYATAATYTPSRYALLTGEYAWRKKGVGEGIGQRHQSHFTWPPSLPGGGSRQMASWPGSGTGNTVERRNKTRQLGNRI